MIPILLGFFKLPDHTIISPACLSNIGVKIICQMSFAVVLFTEHVGVIYLPLGNLSSEANCV